MVTSPTQSAHTDGRPRESPLDESALADPRSTSQHSTRRGTRGSRAAADNGRARAVRRARRDATRLAADGRASASSVDARARRGAGGARRDATRREREGRGPETNSTARRFDDVAMASTSTANDAVTCEIKIDPVAIARAVSHATKHIAREPEDAYEFPSGERDGERGREGATTTGREGARGREDARADARRRAVGAGGGRGTREGAGRAASGMGEVDARRGRDRETSSGETGEVTMRSADGTRGMGEGGASGRARRMAGEVGRTRIGRTVRAV